MKNRLFLTLSCLLTCSGFLFAQDYEDIYYNPKKDKSQKEKKAKSYLETSNISYIVNPDGTISYTDYSVAAYDPYMEERDVDEYNRFGSSYYTTAIDTIGAAIASSEDFRYTQQIQKYYNPTIVVDNATVLGDILNNSYGNVNIVYSYGYPSFGMWDYPYYGGYVVPGLSFPYNPWWEFYLAPGYCSWYSGWYYNPWYYSPWYWNYGWWSPGLNPGLGFGPVPGHIAVNPNRWPTMGANSGWSASARPSLNGFHRTGTTGTTRPGNIGYNNGGHRVSTGIAGTTTRPINGISTRPSSTSARPSGTTTVRPSTTTTHRTTISNQSSGSTYRPSSGSYSSPSSGGMSRGSSSSGGFRSSGGGGGRHR